jgi:hypothetical protein
MRNLRPATPGWDLFALLSEFFQGSSLAKVIVFGPDPQIVVGSLVIDIVKTVRLKSPNQIVALVGVVTAVPLQHVIRGFRCHDEIVAAGYAQGDCTACRFGEEALEAMFKGKRRWYPTINNASLCELCMRASLLADPTLPSTLGAVLAIFAILAGVTRVGARTGRGESVEWNLIEEKNR